MDISAEGDQWTPSVDAPIHDTGPYFDVTDFGSSGLVCVRQLT